MVSAMDVKKITLCHEIPINLPPFSRRYDPNVLVMLNQCYEQTGSCDEFYNFGVFHCTTEKGFNGIVSDCLIRKNKAEGKVIEATWGTVSETNFDFGRDSDQWGDWRVALSKYYCNAIIH